MHKSSVIPICLLASILAFPAFAQQTAKREEPPERPRLDEGSGFSRAPSLEGRIPPISPDDPSRFILDRGIRVEDHPNGIGRYAAQAPGLAAVCDLDTYLPCARILWVLRFPPVSGATYQTLVPARVQLHGPGSEAWWTPSVHCVIYEPRRLARNKVSSGQSCMHIVDAETQQMEWLIGGRIEGLDPDDYGVYEGWIPVTITMGSQQWIVDVPVTYERFKRVASCSLESSTGNPFISGIPHHGDDEDQRGGTVDVSPASGVRSVLALSGDLAGRCGSDGAGCPSLSFTTGWARFQADEGTTWTFDVSSVSFDGGGNTESDWTWTVGYYDYDADEDGGPFVIQTSKSPSFSESADPWFDSNRYAHIFLGGSIEIEDDWEAGSYSETATVTFCCGC
ncbi:MAG: hypothetical protein F4X05_09270 [Rhodothermaceae bacterium]|nr:hypothetical protein [Rhodothermaceae bacterium]